jgi:hypothetical protein
MASVRPRALLVVVRAFPMHMHALPLLHARGHGRKPRGEALNGASAPPTGDSAVPWTTVLVNAHVALPMLPLGKLAPSYGVDGGAVGVALDDVTALFRDG